MPCAWRAVWVNDASPHTNALWDSIRANSPASIGTKFDSSHDRGQTFDFTPWAGGIAAMVPLDVHP